MKDLRIAVILGRGVEGCGVTRYVLEEQSWARTKGIVYDIYASSDKKWPRSDSQVHTITQFSNSEVQSISKKVDDNYDIVYYHSLPAKKGHSEEYQQLFMNHLVLGINKPSKIMYQLDHKRQSITRNFNIWEVADQMDAAYTYSFTSYFGMQLREQCPDMPIFQLTNGFDYDALAKYIVPVAEQKRRLSYFGRFAGFKEPQRMIEIQPFLEEKNIISEMRGIERSIGSLELFYGDRDDRANTYRTNIHEVKKDEIITQTPDKCWIYGPYNRLEGIEELGHSMFGADFYILDKLFYGNNMEFAMSEIIACGSIPVFSKHWGDNCEHISGQIFSDMKDFAIYNDRNDMQTTANELNELANNHELRDKRRKSCLELARAHNENEMIYNRFINQNIEVKKRNPGKTSAPESLF